MIRFFTLGSARGKQVQWRLKEKRSRGSHDIDDFPSCYEVQAGPEFYIISHQSTKTWRYTNALDQDFCPSSTWWQYQETPKTNKSKGWPFVVLKKKGTQWAHIDGIILLNVKWSSVILSTQNKYLIYLTAGVECSPMINYKFLWLSLVK